MTRIEALEAENARLREALGAAEQYVSVLEEQNMEYYIKTYEDFMVVGEGFRRRAEEMVQYLDELLRLDSGSAITVLPRNKAESAAVIIRELAGLEGEDGTP